MVVHKSLFKKSYYLFGERERENEWGRNRERGRERIPSRLQVVRTEPDVGLDLMNREIVM